MDLNTDYPLRCENCQKQFDPVTSNWFRIASAEWPVITICSPTCLTEWAWKIREAVPKLSKSKM